jgi:uncharacterized membrane protein
MTHQAETANIANTSTFPRINAHTISYLLLALAIGVSGYLSYVKFANASAVCLHGGQFDCGTVLNSAYSEFAGIPIAWLGLGTNFVILALIAAAQHRVSFMREPGVFLVFGVVLFAFIYSVYLVYLQAFVIRAYCPWCLTHEALITVLFVVWVRQVWTAVSADEEEIAA